MKAVNLLPPDQRGAAKATAAPAADQPGGAGAYAVLGALAIGVVAVAGSVLTGNTLKERQAQLDALTAREQAVQAKVGDLKPYADFAQLASTRVATVKDLAGRRFDWENALRDLSRAIPANATLTTMNGTVSTDSGGTGGSALRSALNVPAISLAGCTRTQQDVAKLMARLRTVDGVTRVSLGKSTKPDQQLGGVGLGTQDACGKGTHPNFEMVLFFERAADAAAAAGSSTTGTPASTAAGGTSPSATATPAAGTSPTSSSGSATSTPASTTQEGTK
jgi:Tfp pilus assembly protein PilN